MSMEHWWNETDSANLKYADRNCPTVTTTTTIPGDGSRSTSGQADNWLPEPWHCLAARYESPSSCIQFDSPWLSAHRIRAILTSLLICDAILLPKFNGYSPHNWFLDYILNVTTLSLLYALQYTVDLVKWQQKHNNTSLDDWLTVHHSITFVNFQLDAQNSLFIYLYIIHLLKTSTPFEQYAAHLQEV
jgi:hypothetical protein